MIIPASQQDEHNQRIDALLARGINVDEREVDAFEKIARAMRDGQFVDGQRYMDAAVNLLAKAAAQLSGGWGWVITLLPPEARTDKDRAIHAAELRTREVIDQRQAARLAAAQHQLARR